MPRPQKNYDHRLRDLVRRTQDVTLATRLGVPRSTAAGWLRQPDRTTVTVDVLSKDAENLQAEVIRLRRRVQKLRAVVRLLVSMLRAFNVDLSRRRLPDGEAKARLLRAIERAQPALRLRTLLRILGLSSSRFHAWKRAETGCDLDDHSSCPRVSPHQLTLDEIQTIREMVTSSEYRHVSTGALAILAELPTPTFCTFPSEFSSATPAATGSATSSDARRRESASSPHAADENSAPKVQNVRVGSSVILRGS
jgi:hypothetical protein